jgi:hypothetical protein
MVSEVLRQSLASFLSISSQRATGICKGVDVPRAFLSVISHCLTSDVETYFIPLKPLAPVDYTEWCKLGALDTHILS